MDEYGKKHLEHHLREAGMSGDISDTNEVLAEVRKERRKQDKMWGEQNHDDTYWLAILMEEVGEASERTLNDDKERLREELVQTAAVVVAWIECIDRGKQYS